MIPASLLQLSQNDPFVPIVLNIHPYPQIWEGPIAYHTIVQ